ncbi:hypothetical protein F0562_026244 [Nyssa sinensis]|uniref:HTH myb-type domain-containing protein n=1 Tax=Nyssa sinensis TaxID=561372 RepID=A0A5J5BCC5_9ASTE|nr:hypothetical protein F0562_026244 [Nyssa sinensis]
MKEISDSSEDSKSSPGNKNVDDPDGEEDENDRIRKPKNGASSSNSTVEENEKKAAAGSVRQYIRSKNPRLRWTPDLHLRFVHCDSKTRRTRHAGATPKLVLNSMNIKGLNIAHVKSHLQMYRSKKIDNPNHVIPSEQGLVTNGGDHHIYNFSQLPMLQGFNQRSHSSLRCSDALWSRHYNLFQGPCMGEASCNRTRHGLYGTSATETIFGSNNGHSLCGDFHMVNSSLSGQTTRRSIERVKDMRLLENIQGSWQTQIRRTSSMEPNLVSQLQDRNWQLTMEEQSTLKRKVSDSDCNNIDLNLSLKIKPKNDGFDQKGLEDAEVDSSLSLSLFSSSTSKFSWLEESEGGRKHGRMTSTRNFAMI